jgi:multidrug efflux pump subunit AcrA (membrane-fusion protein)
MNMRVKTKTVIVFTVLLIVAGCGGEAERHDAEAENAAPVSVQVEKVKALGVMSAHQAVGTVHSKDGSTLSSKVVGNVLAVHVREGDRVRSGQLLVEIDSREADARVRQAEAGMVEAESALVEVESGILAARSGIDAAEANAKLAKSTYDRFLELLKRKSVSQQEFDEAEARHKGAEAQVLRAKEMLASTTAKKAQVMARISQAEANLENARLYQDYAMIHSPIDGVVTRKTVDVGQLATPGLPLLTIEDSSAYRLEAGVDESQMQYVQLGRPALVRIDALGREFEGKVGEIVPVADSSSRSFTVKIDLPSEPGLRSGLYGRAAFSTSERKVLSVAVSALIEKGQLEGVFVVDSERRARFRLVKTGGLTGDRIEVLSGLKEGDEVVIAPSHEVREGVKLEFSQVARIHQTPDSREVVGIDRDSKSVIERERL